MTFLAMKFTASLDSLVCLKSPSLQLIGLELWRTFCRALRKQPLSRGTRHSESSGEDEVGMAAAEAEEAGMAAAAAGEEAGMVVEVEEAVDAAILAGGAWKLSPTLGADEVTGSATAVSASWWH